MIQKYAMSIPQFKQYINSDSNLSLRFTWMHNSDLLRNDQEEQQSAIQALEVLPSQLRASGIDIEEAKGTEFTEESKERADSENELKKIIEANMEKSNPQLRELLKSNLKSINSAQ